MRIPRKLLWAIADEVEQHLCIQKQWQVGRVSIGLAIFVVLDGRVNGSEAAVRELYRRVKRCYQRRRKKTSDQLLLPFDAVIVPATMLN